MKIKRLAVIGLGLIGGSLARALRGVDAVWSISGFDTDERQLALARELGVIDNAAAAAAEAVAEADVIVIAVPVLHTFEAMQSCGALPAKAIITDVGSTKQSVLQEVARACGGRVPPRFVAGHPIAGTEKSGVAHSIPDLFKGRRVILTPHAEQDPEAHEQVTRLWKVIGARVVDMDPARHDQIFAATSHLPHVLAYAFVDFLSRLDTDDVIFPNAGGGFRDFTRIASSSPEMWHDIIRANGEAVAHLLERQIGELGELLAMMRSDDWDGVRKVFERARAARERHLAQIE